MKNLNKYIFILFVFATFLLSGQSVLAAGLSLSITPTIFEVAAVPGQSFKTSVKVINNNDIPITVYAEPQNFAPRGERGQSSFIPIFESMTDGTTLGEWMDVPQTPFVIKPGTSVAIPVNIIVPADAAPGGHYAAVMVGTKPPAESGALEVRTAQVISSLFFVRIAGDVVEKGSIRTFRSTSKFSQTPEMSFEVRFQNDGNVHLQPQGEIVITNMWGKERGIIPINHKTHFGNVLPESIRQYEFSWRGEQSFTDFGRYTANLTLAYGLESRKFISRTAVFWVIPVKPMLITLSIILLLVWFVSKMVKSYVRRMLLLSGIDPDAPKQSHRRHSRVALVGDVAVVSRDMSINSPVRNGFSDLKDRLANTTVTFAKLQTFGKFVLDYRWFFITIVVVIVAVVLLVMYVLGATTEQRDYEIVIENPSQPVTLSSEEIIDSRQPVATLTDEQIDVSNNDEQAYTITIVNSSDTPGAAAAFKDTLEAAGYTVAKLESDLEAGRTASVVVYDPDYTEQALAISEIAGGVLPSSFPTPLSADQEAQITIYLGNNFEF